MIYNSLDKIPYKIFLDILQSNNVSLLTDEDTEIEKLNLIWQDLYSQHLDKIENSEMNKTFVLSKEIDFLKSKHKIVLMTCDSLRFDINNDLIDLLKGYGYTLRTTDNNTYHGDLDQIERESNAYELKISRLTEKLPKQTDKTGYSIDDVMASYSAILGFDFDYNTITYTKFYSLQRQVQSKIKTLESQNAKTNG